MHGSDEGDVYGAWFVCMHACVSVCLSVCVVDRWREVVCVCARGLSDCLCVVDRWRGGLQRASRG